jgi:hypothetical protein
MDTMQGKQYSAHIVEKTWEPTLRKEKETLANWMHCCEVLVDRTVW